MHPPHVPFEAESDTAQVHRSGNPRECGGLFRDDLDVGVVLVDPGVEPPEEVDRLEVLPASLCVGEPLPRFARVVEVEHGGDRIHPQSVDVVLAQPVLGRREEEAPHLVPAVVEDEALPVGVEAQPWIGVLEEVCSVEIGQCELVGREVGRHPVEDHADAGAVELVDQPHESLRIAVATGRGEVAGRLIAPRPVEGVLHERQELHVGEAAALHMVDKRLRHLVVARETSRLVGGPAPASQMDLVDGDG